MGANHARKNRIARRKRQVKNQRTFGVARIVQEAFMAAVNDIGNALVEAVASPVQWKSAGAAQLRALPAVLGPPLQSCTKRPFGPLNAAMLAWKQPGMSRLG
ncbi:hypothetical protein HYZ99_04115 [Candidatus Peregrinibacteria bacterium]|nr:hypothetical protein [Candidatus Peregrinibacteria bacterium]